MLFATWVSVIISSISRKYTIYIINIHLFVSTSRVFLAEKTDINKAVFVFVSFA